VSFDVKNSKKMSENQWEADFTSGDPEFEIVTSEAPSVDRDSDVDNGGPEVDNGAADVDIGGANVDNSADDVDNGSADVIDVTDAREASKGRTLPSLSACDMNSESKDDF
jgi:hypothetical protein